MFSLLLCVALSPLSQGQDGVRVPTAAEKAAGFIEEDGERSPIPRLNPRFKAETAAQTRERSRRSNSEAMRRSTTDIPHCNVPEHVDVPIDWERYYARSSGRGGSATATDAERSPPSGPKLMSLPSPDGTRIDKRLASLETRLDRLELTLDRLLKVTESVVSGAAQRR